MNKNYQLGLLYLTHLLISADGVINDGEKVAIAKIKINEKIPNAIASEFEESIFSKKEKEIYHEAIELINQCSNQEKLRVFIILYKLSEVDGHVHIKEVKLMIYAIKTADIEFDSVVSEAKNVASFF